MVLRGDKTGVLEDDLHGGVVGKPIKPCSSHSLEVCWERGTSVIEGSGGVTREVGGEDATYIEIMGLEEGGGGHHKAHIVDISHHPAPIDASGAWIDSKANGEEKGVIDGQRDLGRVLVRI